MDDYEALELLRRLGGIWAAPGGLWKGSGTIGFMKNRSMIVCLDEPWCHGWCMRSEVVLAGFEEPECNGWCLGNHDVMAGYFQSEDVPVGY